MLLKGVKNVMVICGNEEKAVPLRGFEVFLWVESLTDKVRWFESQIS